MADRKIEVIINGKEYVSAEAKKAEKSVESFGSKVKDLWKTIAATAAAVALAKFFKDVVTETVAYENSQKKLEATAKLTGVALKDLQDIAEKGRKGFGLSAQTSNDLAVELAKLAQKAGDVSKATPALQAFLDIGAARGLTAAETLKAVQQSILGIDEGTDKLFSKNPSVLYAEYAASIGTTAGKLSDQQKAQALLTAALQDGLKVQGAMGERMGTLGGSLEKVSVRWQEFKVAVGLALSGTGEMGGALGFVADALARMAAWVEANEAPIGAFVTAVGGALSAIGTFAGAIWDVVGPAVTFLAKVAFVALLEGLQLVALGLKRSAGIFQEFAGTALAAIGTLVEKGGKLLRIFGVDAVAESGAALRQYGQQLSAAGTAAADKAVADYKAGRAKIGAILKGSEQEHTSVVKTETAARVTINKKGNADIVASHLDMEIARQKASTATNELLQKTAEALRKQNDELRGANTEWGKQHTLIGNTAQTMKALLPPVENLKQEIEKNNEALKRNAETVKETKQHFKDTVDEAVRMGHGLLDAAQAAGVMDREMASVLGSVLNVADSLSALSVDFSLGGLAGVIGGIANVISTVAGSNKALRDALESNKAALDRLSREVGNFNLGATGKTFTGTEKALQATQAAFESGKFGGAGVNEAAKGKLAREFFKRELIKQGISVEDAEQLIKDLGLGGAFENGTAFARSLPDLVKGFADTEFGQFGQDFESQFRATTEGFGIHDTDKKGQFEELSGLASRFSPALKEALQSGDAKKALSGLFDQLKTGELDAAAFGDLNANQFLDLIKSLLSLLDEGAGVTEPETTAPAIPGGKKKDKDVSLLPEPPVAPLPPLDDDLIGRLLSGGDSIASNPAVVGAVLDKLLGGGDAIAGDAGALSGKLTKFLDLPPVTPPLGDKAGITTADKGGFGGQTSYKQEIGQNVQGDVVLQFNITRDEASDPELIAEIVAQRLGERYTLQKQALGLT